MSQPTDQDASAIRQCSARVALHGAPFEMHYRVAGSGPPLFLLHPSPFSSAFMVPLMRRLARRATLIAPDTPGFGESWPIAHKGVDASDNAEQQEPHEGEHSSNAASQAQSAARGLVPYVEAMIALRKALGLDQIAVYGSATGAQIAIEWAKAEPRALCGLILDNAASFTDAERNRIMDGYFPDLRPTADGAHLARAWQTAHDATLFFPWQQPAAAHRIAPELGNAAAMDASARAYLAAGPNYQDAYRAAFENERAQRVRPISAPLVILRWQGSILKPWTDRFDDLSWGDQVVMAHCGPTFEARWNCLEAELGRVLPKGATRAQRLCLDSGSIRYLDCGFGQIRYRLPDDALPPSTAGGLGIAIHGLGGAGELFDPSGLGKGERWIRIDLPGHGGSASPDDLGIDHCVEAVTGVINELAVEPLRLSGTGVTQALAQMVAERNPHVHAEESAMPWPDGTLPALSPEHSGAHLWRAWYWLRRQYLERNESPPAPERLTRMLLALLSSQTAYRALRPLLARSKGK